MVAAMCKPHAEAGRMASLPQPQPIIPMGIPCSITRSRLSQFTDTVATHT